MSSIDVLYENIRNSLEEGRARKERLNKDLEETDSLIEITEKQLKSLETLENFGGVAGLINSSNPIIAEAIIEWGQLICLKTDDVLYNLRLANGFEKAKVNLVSEPNTENADTSNIDKKEKRYRSSSNTTTTKKEDYSVFESTTSHLFIINLCDDLKANEIYIKNKDTGKDASCKPNEFTLSSCIRGNKINGVSIRDLAPMYIQYMGDIAGGNFKNFCFISGNNSRGCLRVSDIKLNNSAPNRLSCCCRFSNYDLVDAVVLILKQLGYEDKLNKFFGDIYNRYNSKDETLNMESHKYNFIFRVSSIPVKTSKDYDAIDRPIFCKTNIKSQDSYTALTTPVVSYFNNTGLNYFSRKNAYNLILDILDYLGFSSDDKQEFLKNIKIYSYQVNAQSGRIIDCINTVSNSMNNYKLSTDLLFPIKSDMYIDSDIINKIKNNKLQLFLTKCSKPTKSIYSFYDTVVKKSKISKCKTLYAKIGSDWYKLESTNKRFNRQNNFVKFDLVLFLRDVLYLAGLESSFDTFMHKAGHEITNSFSQDINAVLSHYSQGGKNTLMNHYLSSLVYENGKLCGFFTTQSTKKVVDYVKSIYKSYELKTDSDEFLFCSFE